MSVDVINGISGLFGDEGKYKFLTGTLGGVFCMCIAIAVYFIWKGPYERKAEVEEKATA